MEIPRHTVEITKDAAWLLIGNDEKSWLDYGQNEQFEMSTYRNNGVIIFAVCNFTSLGITQYFIQDVNA